MGYRVSYSHEFLTEIKARLAVSEIVSRTVSLKRRGREFVGLSPFNNEKTPSFTVNNEKGFFHCFSTGEHGDIFQFLMKTQNLSFSEAVEILAESAGLALPTSSPEEIRNSEKRSSMLEAAEVACKFYEDRLLSTEGNEAKKYLKQRGFTEEVIRKYRIGYAPFGNVLKSELPKYSVSESIALDVRLLNPGRDGRETFDFFRNRLIFPIFDQRGRALAFGGRALTDNDQPKYLNSPETDLFHKGDILYGLSEARKSAIEKSEIVVVEGYIDVVSLAQSGIDNSVAPLGTALTEKQIMTLWKICPEPIICFDGDQAGRKAALRAANNALLLLKPGYSIRFVMLPDGKDPDDILRESGTNKMRDFLDNAIPLYEILWRSLISGRLLDTPERRAALESSVDSIIANIKDSIIKSHYKQKMRSKIYDYFRSLDANFATKKSNSIKFKRSKEVRLRGKVDTSIDPDSVRQKILLAAFLNHSCIWDYAGERLGKMIFVDSRLDLLRQFAIKLITKHSSLESTEICTKLMGLGFDQELKSLLCSQGAYFHASFARPETDIDRVRIGWDETYALCFRGDFDRDVQLAAEDLVKKETDSALKVFKSLKNQRQKFNDINKN